MKPVPLIPALLVVVSCISLTSYAQNNKKEDRKLFSEVITLRTKDDTGSKFYNKTNRDTSLLLNITAAVQSGRITAYADSQFNVKLSIHEFNEIINTGSITDTLISTSPEDGHEIVRITIRDLDYYLVADYKILASGIVNSRNKNQDIQLLGIAPVFSFGSDKEIFSWFNNTHTYFWVHYEDVKSILDSYDAVHAEKFSTRLKKMQVPDVEVITYNDGTKYIGHFKNGKRNGKGSMYWTDGSMYEGEWKDDKKSGKGTAYMNGFRYTGDWKDDKKSGKGTVYIKNGDRYTGDWKDGEQSGKGTYYFADTAMYEGRFEHGNFNGIGMYKYADGSKYIGEWKDDKKSGEGIYYYADSSMYIGSWKEGVKCDKGIIYYPSKNIFIGNFENDKRNGKGVLYLANSSKYDVVWKNDTLEKHGTYYYSDGSKYVGEWDEHAYFNGQGSIYWNDGDKYEGAWKDGNMDGYGVYTIENGSEDDISNCPGSKIYKGYCKEGLKSGTGACYNEKNEKIYEGRFLDDKPIDPYPTK